MFGTAAVASCIANAGSPPFHHGLCVTDHRCIFMDLRLDDLPGDTHTPLESPHQRLFQSSQSQQRTTLLQHCDAHLQANNICNCMHFLMTMPITDLHQHMAELNQIDAICTQGLLLAEKKTHKANQSDWSPKLKRCLAAVQLWKQFHSMAKNRLNTQNILAQLGRVTDDQSALTAPLHLVNCDKHLRQAQKALRLAKANAPENCRAFLAQRRQELLDDPTRKAAIRAIEHIQKAEARKQAHSNIGSTLKPRTEGGVSHILIPKDLQPQECPHDPESVTEWESIHDPERIQECLLARNKAHFSQADGTPFTRSPLTDVGISANTATADEMLAGQVPASLQVADACALKIIASIASSMLAPLPI